MSRIPFPALWGAAMIAVFPYGGLAAAPPSEEHVQVGRYQLVAGFNGAMFVIDTATGQCWSKARDGRWNDEGNPTKLHRKRRAPLSLELPDEPVGLTILQRQSKAIPGSKDRISLHLDDVTAGQVLLSVRCDDGEILLDDTSVEQGDVVKFKVADKTFYIRVRELRNVLIGTGDFGVFEISSSPPPSTRENGGGEGKAEP